MKLKKKDIDKKILNATECLLVSLPILVRRVEELERQLHDLENEAMIKGIDYSQERVSSSGISKSTEVIALNAIRDKEELKLLIKKEKSHIDWYRDKLDILEADQKSVIEKKLCQGLSWPEVSDQVFISERTCYRKYDEGIIRLAVLFYGQKALKAHSVEFPALMNIN